MSSPTQEHKRQDSAWLPVGPGCGPCPSTSALARRPAGVQPSGEPSLASGCRRPPRPASSWPRPRGDGPKLQPWQHPQMVWFSARLRPDPNLCNRSKFQRTVSQELVIKLITLGCDDIQLDAPNYAPCRCLHWIGVRIACGLIETLICLSGLVSSPQSGFVASQLWQQYSLATDEPSG
jgi:hypothetical protein